MKKNRIIGYHRKNMSRKKEIQYQSLIEIIKTHKGISPKDLLAQLNIKLKNENLATIKDRTLDSIISDIRAGKFNDKPENIVFQNGHYTIENHKLNFYLSELSEEERNTIPFLYSILSKYQYIPSVKMFYSSLEKQIEQNKEIINVNSAVISINNHQKLEEMEMQMVLVKEILNYINNHVIIEFSYQSTSEGKKTDKDNPAVVHPLQIRQYLGKFYLVAATIEEPFIIRTYLLDNIRKNNKNGYRLEPYIEEFEDPTIIKITDFGVYLKKLKLDTHFDHCIGIMRDHKSHPVEIRRWFKGWAATAVISSPLHHSQIIINPEKTYDDGKVLIQIKVYNNEELKNHFGRFGNYSWGIDEEEPEI